MILALDIDRSHRVGNPTRQLENPGISMFSSQLIDCSRQNFYKKRTLLKDNGYLGVLANENLTKFRSGMLYEARKLAKKELINNTWSANRYILVRDKFDIVHRIDEWIEMATSLGSHISKRNASCDFLSPNNLGPVVQSIVSLTNSFVSDSFGLPVRIKSRYPILCFEIIKGLLQCKSSSYFFQQKYKWFCI